MSFVILFWWIHIAKIFGNVCLKNVRTIRHDIIDDNDIRWNKVSPNTYETTLIFDINKIDINIGNNNYVSWIGRHFNYSLPAPTLRLRNGNTYYINVINKLGFEDKMVESNGFGEYNITNLHTHGLHISPFDDNIFVNINGGQSHKYTWNILCNHDSGIHFYHSHHHKSSVNHIGYGAAGVLIVENRRMDRNNLPKWVLNMKEYVLMIQEFDFNILNFLFSNDISGNDYYDYLYLINGEYKPVLCLNRNEWTRLRISYVDIENDAGIYIDGCVILLLAKDGVYISDIPRAVTHLYFTPSSRVDIALKCGSNAQIRIKNGRTYLSDVIGYISVVGSSVNDVIPRPFQVDRPDYLESLMEYNIDNNDMFQTWPNGRNYFDVIIGANHVNYKSYDNNNIYLLDNFDVEFGKIHEWRIDSEFGIWDPHPYHIHINHFQIIKNEYFTELMPQNWVVIGDWVDSWVTPSIIRFKTNSFYGPMLFHCHNIIHSDLGSLGYLNIKRDNEYNYTHKCPPGLIETDNPTETPIYTNNPSISPSLFPTLLPTIPPTLHTVSPSLSPSSMPTMSPTSNPTLIPTSEPSLTPSIEPTNTPTSDPTLTPTKYPTQLPTKTPSLSPSLSPSTAPSKSPIFYPSKIPSFNPSILSSHSPTLTNTTPKTSTPTLLPSISPLIGINPTAFPTTQMPSISPSSMASVNPTTSPTSPNNMSSITTTQTLSPTISTTTLTPTDSPALLPSHDPSNIPTNTTPIPTLISAFPTKLPSKHPTSTPIKSPTFKPSQPKKTSTNIPTSKQISTPKPSKFITKAIKLKRYKEYQQNLHKNHGNRVDLSALLPNNKPKSKTSTSKHIVTRSLKNTHK